MTLRVTGSDFIHVVKNKFRSRKLLREVNATCITLVPKVAAPESLSDYKPILCCNVLYKCITKVMMNRMKIFVNQVICTNHSVFVKGRHI